MSEHATISTPSKQPSLVAAAGDVAEPVLEKEQQQLLPVQCALTVGAPDDPLENEADAMADTVMRMPGTFIQRKCAHCEEEEKIQREKINDEEESVQRKPLASSITPFIQTKSNGEGTTSDELTNQINNSRGNGSNMDGETRSFMENRFGSDFSNVKIHTSNESVMMNRELNAKAFTVGNDIYFNEGQYNPQSDSGKHLLAHELTHTIQQGAAQQIQRDELDDRAAREAAAGSPQLQTALAASFRTALPFSFNTSLEGTSRFTVREGGGIRIAINTSAGGAAAGTTFNLILVQQLRGFGVGRPPVLYTVGTPGHYSWVGLPAGTYYVRFHNNGTGTISGSLWVDYLSGTGVTATTSATDQFEVNTGYNPALQPTDAVAYGQYSLRSEPVSNSFIYGTLPGTPVQVQVIEKRSFGRANPDSEQGWYKLQFSNAQQYNRLAVRVPPVSDSIAAQLYNNQQAWITEKALKIYVPYNTLLQQIRRFDADPSVAGMTVRQRVTYLRQLHQDPELPYDQIIGSPAGTRTVSDRPELSNLIQMLKGPVTGVVLPGGDHVDFAHFLITLDAYQYPDRSATYSVLDLVDFPIGSSHAVMSWSGDVGGATGDYTIAHRRRGLSALNNTLLNEHFERSAPDADLLGNLDGIGGASLLSSGTYATLESLVRAYYEGIAPGTTAPVANALRTHRAAAIASFLGSYGFTSPTGLVAQSAARVCVLNDTISFGIIWYMRGTSSSLSDILSYQDPSWGRILPLAAGEMTNRFLARLEHFATQYGVTAIPATSVRAATCPAPVLPAAPAAPPAAGTSAGAVPVQRKTDMPGKTVQPANQPGFLFTHTPMLVQKQNGGGTTHPSLKSIIFRNSDAIVRAYSRGTLHLGPSSSAASIILLQQALLYLTPSGTGIATNGSYDADTSAAVSAFQRDRMGIATPSGEVDVATLQALDDAVAAQESSSPNAATSASGTLPAKFAGGRTTYISQVDVDLTAQTVTLTWAGPDRASRDTGPFECSTGAGRLPNGTCNDCDNSTVSNTGGTNCTPKGTFTVDGLAPSLPSYPEALFVTFFLQTRGVAFHYYPSVPRHPASHGCVRLHLYPAILIQNNVISGTTVVNVSGTWSRGTWDTIDCAAAPARQWAGERANEVRQGAGRALRGLGEWWDSL